MVWPGGRCVMVQGQDGTKCVTSRQLGRSRSQSWPYIPYLAPVLPAHPTTMNKIYLFLTLPMFLMKHVCCEHQCLEDGDCIVTQHHMCCLDLSDLSIASQPDRSDWSKKCCSDDTGNPIIWPANKNNLTDSEMQQVHIKDVFAIFNVVVLALTCLTYCGLTLLYACWASVAHSKK